ncbi:hypothetical protein [Thermomonospora cellulosilytica]|uniref:Uncharacterized protein n=1 Tax=Thermomonospora cellulosilytica TaxID=1411118 RepID=A0A7W3N1T3_9ACTN|nr:hypothetical protein [Thermomonospora cellulosilytica]MBA9005993.1 hypothetical protein [Thermomonospora cellulosilytica]
MDDQELARLHPRYRTPCEQWLRAEGRYCGQIPTRRYDQGYKCRQHTPSALEGKPEPPPGYCAPGRCYCGRGTCPAFETYRQADTYADNPYAWQVDAEAIASGKRRSSPTAYASARASLTKT